MEMNVNRQNQSLVIFTIATAALAVALFQANLELIRPLTDFWPVLKLGTL